MFKSFGGSLEVKEIKTVDQYIINTLCFTNEVREFVKERSEVERAYAKQLELVLSTKTLDHQKLARKYTRKDKRTSIFGSVRESVILSEGVPSDYVGTIQNTWVSLLSELENTAKAKIRHADGLGQYVTDKLKMFGLEKEESARKQLLFAQKVLDERQKLEDESAKCKSEYNSACDLVELGRQKVEKALDDKSREKLNKLLHQDILDMNNAKNRYVLSIGIILVCNDESLEIANQGQAKYHKMDIPKYLLDMHSLSESVVHGLKSIWTEYYDLELSVMMELLENNKQALKAVDLINEAQDVNVFLAKNGALIDGSEVSRAIDIVFESSGLWKDTPNLTLDEFSKIYLANYRKRVLIASSQIVDVLNLKCKELDSARRLEELYSAGLGNGNINEVEQSIRDLANEITLLNYSKLKLDVQLKHFSSILAEIPDSRSHTFKSATFAIPTTCDFCLQTVWGVSKPGLHCKDCGMNAHVKCELKIAPTCVGLRNNKSKRKTSYSIYSSSLPSIIDTVEAQQHAIILYNYMPLEGMEKSELAVKEGEIVTVIQGLDNESNEGWSLVLIDGKSGLIPTSYMKLIILGDFLTLISGSCSAPASPERHSLNKAPHRPIQHKKSVVAFDYNKASEDEISVAVGDIVDVIEPDDGSGWIKVVTGQDRQEGLMPASYIAAQML